MSKSHVGDGRRSLRHEPLEDRQLLTVTPVGDPFLVNQSVGLEQRLAENDPFAAIFGGQEESNRSVAVDHDGDFVVTWTAYGDADGDGAGVFMRLFGRNGLPLTSEMQVNTFTAGDQRNANVAMDADGDFVIVWESELQDPYDDSSGIFGQRFAANGTPISGEFQVHTSTVGDQVNPEVAMDYDGNFVVTWENQSQYASFFNDIRAQKFTFEGERFGSEIRVNNINIPIVGQESNPTVAMDADGDFVIAWDGIYLDSNGVPREAIWGRAFAPDTTTYGNQFQVSVGDANFTESPFPSANDGLGHIPKLDHGTQRNAKISMDSQGNFVVVWESFGDNDLVTNPDLPDSWGTYFRRFHLDPTQPNGVLAGWPVDTQVNPTYTANLEAVMPPDPDNFLYPIFAGPQINPSVAMDADGDLMIVYNGRGYADYFGVYGFLDDYATGIGYETQGIFIQRYHASAVYDAPDEDGGPTITNFPGSVIGLPNSVNTNATGDQVHPSIAVEPDGDYIVVWDGEGTGDSQGIFARRYNESQDAAGPYATDVLIDGARIGEGDELLTPVSTLTVTFDEQISTFGGTTGFSSVTNPDNWVLLREGVPVFNGIAGVTFGMNAASNKWEAIVTLDGNGPLGGVTPLTDGTYELVAKNTIRDVPGNPLQSSGLLANG
ncbi:MAG: hypothetical protein KDA63_15095, partial [Planctomycetales bacterium]|nr:hypothetical protein [Planctomycetales bacterium]